MLCVAIIKLTLSLLLQIGMCSTASPGDDVSILGVFNRLVRTLAFFVVEYFACLVILKWLYTNCTVLLSELYYLENIRHLRVCIGANMLIHLLLKYRIYYIYYILVSALTFFLDCFHQSESYASPLHRVR